MGPTILFTHLKIILLQCFQFSVFSNNKLNPNGSLFREPQLCDCGKFFFGFTTIVLCCLSLTTYNLSSCEMFCENYCYYGVIDP